MVKKLELVIGDNGNVCKVTVDGVVLDDVKSLDLHLEGNKTPIVVMERYHKPPNGEVSTIKLIVVDEVMYLKLVEENEYLTMQVEDLVYELNKARIGRDDNA